MILGLTTSTHTMAQVLLSLVGNGSGLVVLAVALGNLATKRFRPDVVGEGRRGAVR